MTHITHRIARFVRRLALAVSGAALTASAWAADTTASVAKQAAGAHMAHQGGSSMMFVMLLLVVAFYFLLIRPQTKRAKEHRQLVNNIALQDEVVTTAGLVGRIVKLHDSYIVLSVANGTELTFQKSAIAMVLPKGTIETIK